jgi:hypothetical protein
MLAEAIENGLSVMKRLSKVSQQLTIFINLEILILKNLNKSTKLGYLLFRSLTTISYFINSGKLIILLSNKFLSSTDK